MATDATGVASSPDNIPTYNTAADAPSGKGLNAIVAAIQAALSALRPSSIIGYPADATKYLRGDGTWATAGVPSDGWTALSALTYGTTDGHTFTATYAGDLTASVPVGARVKLTNQAATQYFIVTAHVAGTLTLYGGTTYSITATAITNPFFSREKSPVGFPLDPLKWTEELIDVTDRNQAAPVSATWYNIGALSLAVPIGAWDLSYRTHIGVDKGGGAGDGNVYASLSTVNNAQGDVNLTSAFEGYMTTSGIYVTVFATRRVLLAAKTTYFLNLMSTNSPSNIWNRSGQGNGYIRAISAYL